MTRSASSPIRFGEFRLDEDSGELRRERDDAKPVRLAPQPTRLLVHLIRRRPSVVSRDEIVELLWPDVEVDVEQSVHACIRQIRIALDEAAGEPRFIETIPRRGYRFIGEIERDAPDGGDRDGEAAGAIRRRTPWLTAGAIALVIVAVVVMLTTARRSESAPTARPLRIAVMPFEPLGEDAVLEAGNGTAEAIVRVLAGGNPPAFEVIGPTTTQAYDGDPQRLRELIEEYRIDLVVNARQTRTDSRVLIELIRGSDGAHVWVRYLDELPADRTPAELIAEAAMQEAGS